MSLLGPHMKAIVAFLSLASTGLVLILLGERDAGLPMLSTAPFVSGLVWTVRNEPRKRRSRAR